MRYKEQHSLFQCVSFLADGKEYAVEIGKVVEIIYWKKMTPVPGAPSVIEGVIDLRGEVVPVLDLKKLLLPYTDPSSSPRHIVIVSVHEKVIGFVVDEVRAVLRLEEEEIHPPPSFGGSAFVRGVCRVDDRLIFLLDLESLIGVSDTQVLEGEQQ